MKKTIILSALALLSASQMQAQDILYGKSTDRFKENTVIDISEYDSIEFKKMQMTMYKTNESGTTLKVPRTYASTIDYYTFTDPGRIIYRPNEFNSMDFTKETSRWCWARSRESEHFIVFWEPGFGLDPSKSSIKLDVDLLLQRAEVLFDFYANKLGFVIPGDSKSTDKYKIEIFVNYSTDWLATGSGYDDKIGALWCTPWALEASGGHTVGHEIGHSFQYLVSCDLGNNHGWKYGFGDDASGGCAWWESCAQWQAFKVYPEQQFNNGYYSEAINCAYMNLLHEYWRYANYFIQDYWCQLHGQKFIGTLWRESTRPEDPVETYQRITEISQSEFNDEIFNFACRSASWDIDAIREYGKNHIDAYSTNLTRTDDGWWQVDSANCPQNYGFNIIRVNGAPEGTVVKANFKGIAGAEGYRAYKADKAGWRYGFCALKTDGERVYGQAYSNKEGTAEFTVPENCKMLWFVVSGAPTEHWRHPWDMDGDNLQTGLDNDEQWPYQVKFENTERLGYYTFPEDYVRKDTTVVYDIDLTYDGSGYGATAVNLDVDPICQALGVTADMIKKTASATGNGTIKFYSVSPSGVLGSNNTANGLGHWFNASGTVVNHGGSAYVFSEFTANSLTFAVGQYPARLRVGKTYTVRQALQYTHTDGKKYTATIVFNVTVVK